MSQSRILRNWPLDGHGPCDHPMVNGIPFTVFATLADNEDPRGRVPRDAGWNPHADGKGAASDSSSGTSRTA